MEPSWASRLKGERHYDTVKSGSQADKLAATWKVGAWRGPAGEGSGGTVRKSIINEQREEEAGELYGGTRNRSGRHT